MYMSHAWPTASLEGRWLHPSAGFLLHAVVPHLFSSLLDLFVLAVSS